MLSYPFSRTVSDRKFDVYDTFEKKGEVNSKNSPYIFFYKVQN